MDKHQLEQLSSQVKRNCDISDATHAGLYSICGLAMRLRDLYKWSYQLSPWQEHPADQVLAWIGEKENLWEGLVDEAYQRLEIDGHSWDPFDSTGINDQLIQHNLFYGAGYAHSLKPTFLLAQIDSRQSARGLTVWRLGREYARDLLTLPAFTQDDHVVLRCQAARMFLWDQIQYINRSGRPALIFALKACCGLTSTEPEAVRAKLDMIAESMQTVYIQHEIGELCQDVFDRDTFRRMLAEFPHSVVELLIRALKDLLADTGPQGTLHHLIQNRDAAGLGFYVAFQQGLPSVLVSELRQGFQAFMGRMDWGAVERMTDLVYRRTAAYTRQVVDFYLAGLHGKGAQWTQDQIEQTMRERGILK
jgi:hypothetical protein